MAGAMNYTEVTERTRETVMSYAQEQWPVIKSSVSRVAKYLAVCCILAAMCSVTLTIHRAVLRFLSMRTRTPTHLQKCELIEFSHSDHINITLLSDAFACLGFLAL